MNTFRISICAATLPLKGRFRQRILGVLVKECAISYLVGQVLQVFSIGSSILIRNIYSRLLISHCYELI